MLSVESNIGRFAIIKVNGERLCGNVIDLFTNSDRPKRIRIQHGNPSLKGNVVQPHEYSFICFADEEEI